MINPLQRHFKVHFLTDIDTAQHEAVYVLLKVVDVSAG